MDRKHLPYIYSTDLLATGSAVARRALIGEPILIYPTGQHHRPDLWTGEVRTWTVDEAVVAQLVDNYTHREERGIRQTRLPVNEDHGSRALGWFKDVVALPGGLGATFTWNCKGREALEAGEFAYFSAEIYDELIDRVTGQPVRNQLAGESLCPAGIPKAVVSARQRDAERVLPGSRHSPARGDRGRGATRSGGMIRSNPI
ncbi:MAG: hypothetical protein JXA33_21000 [Anaerolineae bacterium]|nr:hypothetical protein [Anaerolineae bacterium]